MNYYSLSTALYDAVKKLDTRDDDVICGRIDELDAMVKTESIKALFENLGIDKTTLEIAAESGDFQIIAANAVRDMLDVISKYERARVIVEHREAA